MADKIKFALALLLVAAGVLGFYLLGEAADPARAVRAGGCGCGRAVAWFTEPGQRFFVFSQEAWTETKKVAWPSRKETVQTTGVVFAFVLVMAIVCG
jgi:preprotein translocase subunit SecE